MTNIFCNTCKCVMPHSSDGRCSGCENARDLNRLETLKKMTLEQRVAILEEQVLKLSKGDRRL
jgi:hypothetical protein